MVGSDIKTDEQNGIEKIAQGNIDGACAIDSSASSKAINKTWLEP